jgi:acetylornithine deacetylase/succinyl-diaminopimelate desuccinylase-like protein
MDAQPRLAATETPVRRARRLHSCRPASCAGSAPRRPLLKTGNADMNMMAGRWPVPMAANAQGDSSPDHTDDEHVEADEFLLAVAILDGAFQELAEGDDAA